MSLPPADERLARGLVEAWRLDEPHPARVQRAYLEFLRRRPGRARPGVFQVATWVALGMLLGMGSLYAATNAPWHWLGLGQRVVAPASAPPRAQATSVRDISRPSTAPLTSAAQAAPAVELPVVRAPASAPSASEQWQRAARGLRERDFDTASAALDELSRRGSGTERESAQLVRAQLLLRQGQQGEAISQLRALQGSAQSAAVRRKASELLAGLSSAPSQRSFSPVEGTNQP